jgi:mono/diheme cytochrome c family protein
MPPLSRLPVRVRWLVFSVSIVLIFGGFLVALVLSEAAPNTQPTTTPIPRSTATKPRSDLAPPATSANVMIATPNWADHVPLPQTTNFDGDQVALGRRTYTQWCATCHGDKGQGLAIWRYSWNEKHQNCAQSGCHGTRRGEGGFTMLAVPSALMGENTLAKFLTAAQLYTFIRATMPFQAPGSLSDEEYWAVTAYLADQHRADAGKLLDAGVAANVRLR